MQAEQNNALLRLEWLEAACKEYGVGLDSDGGIWCGEEYLGTVIHTPVWWIASNPDFQGHCFTAADAVFVLWYWRKHGY